MRGGSSWNVSSCSANCVHRLTGTQHLVAPVVLTDGMAAAIRATHLVNIILHHRQKVSRLSTAPRDEPSTLQIHVRPQQHRELQGGGTYFFNFHAMLWMRRRRCCPGMIRCIAAAFPNGPRERPIRFSLPSKASAGGPPRPRPCKSCKSLRTRPSSKKNARRVKRRPHNRPRRHFLV